MSKRVKKRFTSNVNVIDFATFIPQKNCRVHLYPRNETQKSYIQKLQNEDNSILFAIGPAGTGKTLLAVQAGIKFFQEGKVDKLIVTRPAVSVDEDLGFLPGTLNQKMEPWTKPIFDVLGEYYSQRDIVEMLSEGVIEISPLAYMRGRTFKRAWIIADEMQNATANQMKMLLTRLGDQSRMVVTGDLAQADRLEDNGLVEFCNLLGKHKRTEHIDIVRFEAKDIERHQAVKEVLSIYGD
ncbi:PhoH family protein [bacterium]|jgi:phosphate starvation-inducible PhoH-like protein|nr:PhoH family protein [bacterium]